VDEVEIHAWPDIDRPARGALESVGHVVQPEAGEVLWEAGDAYDLYLVLAGAVSLVDRRDNRVAFVVEPGDFVGELGMLMGQPAFLAGVATAHTVLLRVRVGDLRRLLATSVEVGDLVLSAFDARRRLLTRSGEGGLVLAGEDDRDLHRLQEFAARNHIPYRTVLRSDHDSWAELSRTCPLPGEGAAVLTGTGRALIKPTTRDLAAAIGLDLCGVTDQARCDVLIVGAGPAGLAAAVYGASEGLDVVLVDDVAPGGQAGTSSRIENYLGFPGGVAGSELARLAVLQAVKFGARLVVPRSVTELTRIADGFRVRLDDRSDVFARAVVIASGVQYRRLHKIPGVADLEGRGVYYAATELEARACHGRQVVVVGGANSAGQAALFLAQHANHVHVLIRREHLSATMSTYLADRLIHHERITVHHRSQLISIAGDDRLTHLTWHNEHRQRDVRVEATGLFLMIGAVPRTSWFQQVGVGLDRNGFAITGGTFATSVPGLYAVGDVRAGSVKRVASAVGEGSVVVSAVHSHLHDDYSPGRQLP
jgi:thioredoxin reductase (NADPH)